MTLSREQVEDMRRYYDPALGQTMTPAFCKALCDLALAHLGAAVPVAWRYRNTSWDDWRLTPYQPTGQHFAIERLGVLPDAKPEARQEQGAELDSAAFRARASDAMDIYNAGIEAAAKVCDEREELFDTRREWDGAEICSQLASAIRNLKESP